MANAWRNNWAQGDAGHPNEHNKIAEVFLNNPSIRDFGARSSLNDNTSAIQEALDYAASIGSWLTIPSGIYKTLSPLYTPAGLIGIRGDGEINYRGDDYALCLGDKDYGLGKTTRSIHLEGIKISGLGSSNAKGLFVKGWGRATINKVTIDQFADTGLFMRYAWIGQLSNLIIKNCGVGFRAFANGETTIDQAFNGIWIVGGEIGAGCEYGAIIGDETLEIMPSPTVGSGSGFSQVIIEGTKKGGIWIAEGSNISINDCYFERNGYVQSPSYPLGYNRFHIKVGTDTLEARYINIENNEFAGNINSDLSDIAYGILVKDLYHGAITKNKFKHGIAGRGVEGIHVDSADYLDIRSNSFNGAIDTHYTMPANSSIIIEDMRANTGLHMEFGDLGYQVQAKRGFIMRFLNGNGEVQSAILPDGTMQLKDQATNELRTIRINNGVLEVV